MRRNITKVANYSENGNKFEKYEVECEFVFLNLHKSIIFFIHKDYFSDFNITENSTGALLCKGETKKRAIKKAEKIFSKYTLEEVKNKITETILEVGRANE